MIDIKIGPINNSLAAVLQMNNGVRQNGNFQLRWPIPDFEHFLWAVRGLCHETFVQLDEEIYHYNGLNLNWFIILAIFSECVPEIEDPDDEESGEGTSSNVGGGTNDQPKTSFSIFDGHRELRLEEMASHLGLEIKRFFPLIQL